MIGDRPLHDICLVDNALYSFYFQLENGIPILPFYSNKKDSELLKLCAWLLDLPLHTALTESIPHYFNHSRLKETSSIKQLRSLYRPC